MDTDRAKLEAENQQIIYTIRAAMYSHNFIRYADIANGGTLHLQMDSLPNKERGLKEEEKPFPVSR